ncbi:MAG: LuxR C-terminal-related transcriptional regulator, partial [Mycobacterium sp.]
RTRLVADPARTAIDAVGQLDETIGHLQAQKDPTLVTLVAAASHYVDRVRVLRPDLLLISRNARQGGALSLAISALMPVCIDDVRTGRWEDADRLIAECLDLCRETGFLMQSWPVRLAAAWLAGARGDDGAARRIGTEVLRWASASGAGGAVRFAHQVLASSALAQGNWEDAYIHASTVSAPGVLEPNVGHALWAAFDLVEAAVRAGHAAEAAAHSAALRDARLDLLSPRLALIVAGSSAMVASDADFADLFDRALASPGASDWPLEQARLNLVCGERLRRCRRISKARAHLRRAVDGFAALGAPTWRARAQAELDATGQRDRGGDARSPMGALTPQEMQVARLAATGLTNKAIAERLSLSHRTVGAHLEQVLPKLGINSRARLHEVISGLSDAARDGVS